MTVPGFPPPPGASVTPLRPVPGGPVFPLVPPRPPGRSERFQAERPFLYQVVFGLAWVAVWLGLDLLGGQFRWWTWWTGLVLVEMFVVLPLVNVWAWRDGGGRRRRYDERVRASGGGAARLGG